MNQEKILSKVLIPATGETYTIGVRGSREQVALKLTADSLINWHEHEVTIQNLSDGTEQTKQLSTNGECNFEIPLGNRYSIILPYIEGYIQPNALVYTASISSRNIEYSYNNLNEYLTIRIVVRSEAEEHTAAMFNGIEVTCKGSNGINYNGTLQNGQVTILIPYGITYTIEMPQIAGLSHNHANEIFKAGITARNLAYSYIDYHNLHITGLDKDGNVYTIADLQERGVEWCDANIIAGAYNDQTLALAPRKDGGTGCGFAFSVNTLTVLAAWAHKSVDFGIDNPVVADAIATGILTEGCGYYKNYDQAFAIKDGAGESALIMQVGRVLADAGLLDLTNPTPIFQQAFEQKLTIAGVERSGFVPSFGQMAALLYAINELTIFFSVIGKPSFIKGNKFTSCQCNSIRPVSINDNVAFVDTFEKTDTRIPALCCFDLP